MSKSASGVDARLPAEAFDLPRFLASVARWQPEAIACTSLNAASVLLGLPARRLAFGEHAGQPPAAGFPRPFILPSPSGANGHWAALRHHWDEAGQEPWLRAAEGRGERGMSHRA